MLGRSSGRESLATGSRTPSASSQQAPARDQRLRPRTSCVCIVECHCGRTLSLTRQDRQNHRPTDPADPGRPLAASRGLCPIDGRLRPSRQRRGDYGQGQVYYPGLTRYPFDDPAIGRLDLNGQGRGCPAIRRHDGYGPVLPVRRMENVRLHHDGRRRRICLRRRADHRHNVQVVFAGDSNYAGAASATAPVIPKVLLSKPAAPRSTRTTTSFTCSCYLMPKHPAGSPAVSFERQRYASGHWIPNKMVPAFATDSSDYTACFARIGLNAKGSLRIRSVTRRGCAQRRHHERLAIGEGELGASGRWRSWPVAPSRSGGSRTHSGPGRQLPLRRRQHLRQLLCNTVIQRWRHMLRDYPQHRLAGTLQLTRVAAMHLRV